MSEKEENQKKHEPVPFTSNMDNYSGYGYGYGYGHGYNNRYGVGYGAKYQEGESDGLQGRTPMDYIAMFRERIWYVILSVFVFVTGVLIYTQNAIEEYTAISEVRVLRAGVSANKSGFSTEVMVSQDDFMTQIAIMQSETIIQRVYSRLNQKERTDVIQPYQGGNIFSGPLTAIEVIAKSRQIIPKRSTFIAQIVYTHRSPDVAKKLADYFAEEINKFSLESRIALSNPVIQSTELNIKQLEGTLISQRKERDRLIEEGGVLKVDAGIADSELAAVISATNIAQKDFEDCSVSWNEILRAKKEGRPLLLLPEITRNPLVASLTPKVADLRISFTAVQERYGPAHPKYIEQQQQLQQAEFELDDAVKKATAEFEATYVTTKRRYETAQRRVEEKTANLIKLREANSKVEELKTQIRLNEELLQKTKLNLEELKMQIAGQISSTVDILTKASVPTRASNKQYLMNVLLGIVGGLAVGVGIVLLLSFFDDRVKSSRDIEVSLGIPLLSAFPKISGISEEECAKIVDIGKNREALEAFRSLYSSLKIGELSKDAKVILVTSTMPSEGKTFVSTNLALTYANHGEKVLLIDADLRLPNVGPSLGIKTEKGVTSYIKGESTLEESIISNYLNKLDVFPVGIPSSNPTRLINESKFSEMITICREKYDRIIIDTPPIGAVSDVLTMLPLCDGLVYTVKFNAVRRSLIKANLMRIQEAKTPVFGIVMNQMSRHTASYFLNTGNAGKYNKYYSRIAQSEEA